MKPMPGCSDPGFDTLARGNADHMTPPQAAQGLISKALKVQVVYLPGGHHQMIETPEPMLAALAGFLKL